MTRFLRSRDTSLVYQVARPEAVLLRKESFRMQYINGSKMAVNLKRPNLIPYCTFTLLKLKRPYSIGATISQAIPWLKHASSRGATGWNFFFFLLFYFSFFPGLFYQGRAVWNEIFLVPFSGSANVPHTTLEIPRRTWRWSRPAR